MSSLIGTRLRKSREYRCHFNNRNNHVDVIRPIVDSIIKRSLRFGMVLYREHLERLNARFCDLLSNDPDRTLDALMKYKGYGRILKSGEFEVDAYRYQLLLDDAEYYSKIPSKILIDKREVNKEKANNLERSEFELNVDGDYTKLNTCELCKRTSTPKNVNVKYDCMYWDLPSKHEWKKENKTLKGYFLHFYSNAKEDTGMLCVGCWNKVRVIVKRQEEAEELTKLSNKLKREELKWRKSQTLAS